MRVEISLRVRHRQGLGISADVQGTDLVPYALRQTDNTSFASWEIFSADVPFGVYDESQPDWTERLAQALAALARWLAGQDPSRFDPLRAKGYAIDLFCCYFLEEEMLDIAVPPELMEQLGRFHIPVTIRTEGDSR